MKCYRQVDQLSTSSEGPSPHIAELFAPVDDQTLCQSRYQWRLVRQQGLKSINNEARADWTSSLNVVGNDCQQLHGVRFWHQFIDDPEEVEYRMPNAMVGLRNEA